jgi:imidazolonepropionase-like amidohydrolase
MRLKQLAERKMVIQFHTAALRSHNKFLKATAAWRVALLTSMLVAFAAAPLASAQSTLVIRDGTLFDAIKGVLLPHRTIIIESGRIQDIASAEQPTKIPSAARIIDARGKYILPGLIDAHVHLVHVLDFAHITGEEILPLFLANGVTALRDAGDNIVAESLIARYAESHPRSCPRVFLCSPLIDGDPPYHGDNGVSWSVTDPAQVSLFVHDMADWGATTLKIYVGIRRPIGQAVIKEGHHFNLSVTAHLGNYLAQDAVADGIDCLEHIWSVFNYILPPGAPQMPSSDEEHRLRPSEMEVLQLRIQEARANVDLSNPKARALIASLVDHKVLVDPTLVVYQNMLLLPDVPEVYGNPDNAFVPTRLRVFWPTYTPKVQRQARDLRRKEFRKYQDLTTLLYRAGVKLLAGTDTPEPYVPPGFSLHQELELLVGSGLTPTAALQAATINNAQALRKSEELGSIDRGKWADVLILNSNPLEDIHRTRDIYMVMRGGLVVSRPRALLKDVPSR